MIEIPVQRPGYGFPDDLMPMPDYWQLPTERAINHPSTVLDEPEAFDREYLVIYMSAKIKRQVAGALPKLKTVRFLEIDAYTIPQDVIDRLQDMPQLERLALAPIRTNDLNFLDRLPRLNYLSLESIPNVADLGPVVDRENLVSLVLGTSANDLNAIQDGSLPKLRCLVLSGIGESKPARFPTLEPLQNLQNLEYLCLLNCRAADKSLRFALSLPKLKKLHLYSARPWNKDDIAALMKRGVSVTRIV